MFREGHAKRWLFALILLAFPSIYYLTDPVLRHRGPIEPLVVMLSVYGLIAYLDARREARRDRDLRPVPSI
jgi:hypothetical protein